MTERVGKVALIAAVSERRRNLGAAGLVGAALGIAFVINTRESYYVTGLVVFTVWMVWFVLTAIDWVQRADF